MIPLSIQTRHLAVTYWQEQLTAVSAAAVSIVGRQRPALRSQVADEPARLKQNIVNEKPFACDQCDYRCTQNSRLRSHRLTHTGEKLFACDQCDYRCTTSSLLRTHQRMHTGEKSFACDQCEYRCAESGNLRTHQRTHTGGDSKNPGKDQHRI